MTNQASFIANVARTLRLLANGLEHSIEPTVPYTNRVHEMPTNSKPSHPDFVRCFGDATFWPTRDLSDITGLTIHHALSHSPLATAKYCTQSKGYPSIQYHYWVSADDDCPIYRLADDSWALWHDHTGTYQSTLSIALAGRWDYHTPSDDQLKALARITYYLLNQYNLTTNDVQGHTDRAGRNRYGNLITVCPGWYGPHGVGDTWRTKFFEMLKQPLLNL